ncbi:UDP-N-acetylmuramoylalanyl-D-glutamyl-2,6-diaminopimelate/ D-alanyl-D-alanyl ligase [Fibrella aestuarina BUZ 2]|uniref:UDP-N-acetylmuramoyl-tripeptide--D-alanyl-D-alanine ligase n=1 Tax=Fibrella aestuarina BUZ 2 TaxID=1166018 RepID=I0K436_9BACT|nr:UDP-N-acetylmuramoyl-tripeptide--D-alanyl-D-alanine ligase [Fibrella aestuarina]CCG98889.1 UDP-N-acetylmuramoylalanyl-D-glutamyl-2,6-diaminopimelate/ D-alanyl-D-alanyl ligase [Fibrella aestuarina BUZ 2]
MLTTAALYEKYRECTTVSTDTRQIAPDCLFVALRGDKFDGNQFALQALEAGARYALVDNADVAAQHDRCLLVADTLLALQELARHHRRTFGFPVLGLTGSNGKTTTKELIAAVLAKKYAVEATHGNLNNHIGVPLTLLRIDPARCQLAVVEMGANHQREIDLLSRICEPTHGLITNVGKAHLEGFGGVEGVRKGKGELFDYLAETGGTVFVNAQNAVLMAMQAERSTRTPNFGNVVFYLTDNVPELLTEAPVATYRTATGEVIQTHLPGRYNFENVAAALAIGQYFGVPDADANQAVADYNPTNNRSQVVVRGTNTVLLDAYNANPSSMAAAVQQFGQMPAERKAVILGDMYELGDESPAEHAALGTLIAQQHFDLVILAGKDMQYALPSLPQAYYFPDKFSLHNWIMDNPMQHTHVLIKGSRGMGLESVLPFI